MKEKYVDEDIRNNSEAEWKKIFVSNSSDKGLIISLYRELKILNSPKIKKPIKQWATEVNRICSKEEVQMDKKKKKHMKKCSSSLATKEMQIKTRIGNTLFKKFETFSQ
jgi:hypothetical protein